MSARAAAIAALSCCAFAAGCNALIGLQSGDERGAGGGGGAGGSGNGAGMSTSSLHATSSSSGSSFASVSASSAGGSTTCDDGVCVEQMPGWAPVLVSFSSGPGCAGDNPVSYVEIPTPVPMPSCDCSCSVLYGACSAQFYLFSDENCQSPSSSELNVPGGQCGDVTVAPFESAVVMVSDDPGLAVCNETVDSTPPPLPAAMICSSAGAPSCGASGVCLVGGGSVCVLSPTATECPPDYPEMHTLFAAVNDTRGCSGSCDCTFGGEECDGTYSVFSAPSCAGGPSSSGDAPKPCDLIGDPVSLSYQPASLGTCAGNTQTNPTGTVTGEGHVTACCLPSGSKN